MAILAVDLFNSPLSTYKDVTIFPFIYLYVVLMMMFLPLLKFSDEKAKNLIMPNRTVMNLLSITTIITSFIYIIIQGPNINFSRFFVLETFAENYINYTGNVIDHEVSYGFMTALNALRGTLGDVILLLLVYNLLFIKNKFITIGLVVSLIIKVFTGLSTGARGGITSLIMDIPFIYVAFSGYMTKKNKKTVLKWISIVFMFVTVSFFAVTIGRGRLAEKQITYSLEEYAGQSFLNFNNYGLDAGGTRDGDRTATLFKKMLGFQTANNYQERRLMYSNMKMNDAVFYTFVGDFTLDYGTVPAFFILMSISFLFFKTLSAKKQYDFGQILLFFLLYQICMHGFSLFTFSSFGGNLKLILILFLYIIIKKTNKVKYSI
jgi:oligosaccharide repeat unit polymerase